MLIVARSHAIKHLRFAAIAAALLCGGCAFSSYTTPVAESRQRTAQTPSLWSQLPASGRASIGDNVFWVRRYVTGATEQVGLQAPTKLLAFPVNAKWFLTHTYDHLDGHGLSVYTSPQYYRGAIGVILDSEDRPSTERPVVQVDGTKAGRRWALAGEGKFFIVPDTLIEQWGVRYGGKRGTDYVFEIVNIPNPSVSQITQSVLVPSSEFFSGFTVKEVFIQGIEDLGGGVITFALRDNRVEK